MNSPTVSLILTTYNRPRRLREALTSVRGQRLGNLELIVVNDGGEDVSALIEDFGDPRFSLLTLETNGGVSRARNRGLEEARGEYLGFLDDDDVLLADHLELLSTTLAARSERVVYSDALQVTLDPAAGPGQRCDERINHSHDFHPGLLFIHNLAPIHCFLFERTLLAGGARFDESLPTHEDWDFWLQLSRLSPFYHLNRVTCEYRTYRGEESLSKDGGSMLQTLETIYARTEPLVRQNPSLMAARQRSLEAFKQSLATGKTA